MALTLAFDTSADFCAAALLRDGTVLTSRAQAMTRGHAEALVPMIQALADEAGVAFPDIDLIGVTVGPGSYTGVRTGIAAARGFALGAGAPAIGVSAMAAVARPAARQSEDGACILCVLDTRRSDFFAQLFDRSGDALDQPAIADLDALQAVIEARSPVLAGNAVPRLLAGLPDRFNDTPGAAGHGTPDPADIAAIAEATLNKQGVASDTLSPLYLRAAEAKRPVAGGRLKN